MFREHTRLEARGPSTEVAAVEYTEEGGIDDRDMIKDNKVSNANSIV